MSVNGNHEIFSMIVECFGWEGLLDHLSSLYPAFSLYSVSQDWLQNKSYVCKAKGTGGDIVVSFTT